MILLLPKITVITSTFNSAATLRRALDSVENQDYDNVEHIIIDGASKDDTCEIIKEYTKHKNSKISFWMSEQDDGVYDAWNKALPHITGDWVCFLGSDDFYASMDVFSKAVNTLSTLLPETLIAYGKIIVFDLTPENQLYVRGCPWDIAQKSFFKGVMIPHPAVFHRSEIFKTYGIFDSSFKIAGDYELLMRVLKNTTPVFMDLVIMMMQFGGASSNPKTMIQSGDEIVSAYRKNNIEDTGGFKLKLRVLKIASTIAPNATANIARKLLDNKVKS